VEETALVRADDDREEGCEGFVAVLFREEVEAVRERTGACVDSREVEVSLVLGSGLAAASASSFSRALTFRVRESAWKLSFLRSLSTLVMDNRQTTLRSKNTTTYTRYLSSVLSISAHFSFKSSSISSYLSCSSWRRASKLGFSRRASSSRSNAARDSLC